MVFLLLHGGWHGAWCWRFVAPLLRAAGHEVHTPALTGLGERAHLLEPLLGLSTHVEDVLDAFDEQDLRDVVLVGHSYAGMVITAVVDQAYGRLRQLVYLDAFVPADGQSLFDLLPEERRAMYQRSADEEGDGWRVPPPPPAALGVVDPELARFTAQRLTPQPLRTFVEPVRLADPPGPALPRSFVHCTAGPIAPSFAPFARRARECAGWEYRELATGHDAMLTLPRETAATLVSLAAGPP